MKITKNELRNIIKEELNSRGSKHGPKDPEGALEALKKIASRIDLPIEFKSAEGGTYDVPVPKALKSLFKRLWIKLEWYESGTFGTLNWKYEHPDGGNNGLSIATFGCDEKDNSKWGYRSTLNNTGGQWLWLF